VSTAGAELARCLSRQGRAGVEEPCCDLLLLNEEDWGEEGGGPDGRKAARDLLRCARCLHVPVQRREWAIEVGRRRSPARAPCTASPACCVATLAFGSR
jgi:hypothetical protein